MVLGGDSEILDLGRNKGLYDLYQRIANRHRDQQCTTLDPKYEMKTINNGRVVFSRT